MNKERSNIAFMIIGISDLGGSGGAERFFADFFDAYLGQQNPKRKLIFISDNFENLYKINKLKTTKSAFTLKVNRNNKLTNLQWRYPSFKNVFLALNELNTFFSLIRILRKNKISILHIPLYEVKDYYLLKWLKMFSSIKLVINIVDPQVPFAYFNPDPRLKYSNKYNYGKLFSNIKIDAIYSWYEDFKTFDNEHKVVLSRPPITVIKSRFTSAQHIPEELIKLKKNIIIFAARLDPQKNPLFFLKSIDFVNKKYGMNNWKVEMYGRGELEKDILEFISNHNLTNIVSLSSTYDLPSKLKNSKCFVSTQDYENFPSLSMAEGMANANVIVARNVGQTHYFVKDKLNGFLPEEDTPESLSECIARVIALNDQEQTKMALENLRILREIHNVPNFIAQTDEFWDSIDSRK